MQREELLERIVGLLEAYNVEKLRLIETMLTALLKASERTTELSVMTVSSIARHAK